MTAIATDTGALLGLKTPATQWVESFNRANGPLGNGWTDGHDWDPDIYEPLGILNGDVVCTDPQTRPGTYATNQNQSAPPANGELYQGIGCAWRDFGVTAISVSCEWSGVWTSPIHTEGGPLLHITPGTSTHGIGLWPVDFSGIPTMFLGTIGSPPEQFDALTGATFRHTEGTPRSVTLVSDGAGVTVYLDGKQMFLTVGGYSPYTIPAELADSTLHGFCVDTHLVTTASIPTTPVIKAVSFKW